MDTECRQNTILFIARDTINSKKKKMVKTHAWIYVPVAFKRVYARACMSASELYVNN